MYRSIITRATPALRAGRVPARTFTSSPMVRSTQGYGDAPEGGNNTGKPTPQTSGSEAPGASDPETSTSTKKTAGGQTGLNAESAAAKKENAVGQGIDKETTKVLGEDGAGKSGPPKETKKIGEKPEKH